MAGTVDKNGVLWKSTRVGSFVSTPAPGIDTAWAAICDAVEKYGQDPAVGWRPVKERHQVEGFEKLVLGDYQWMSYKDYFTRLENFGSGLASLGLAPGSNVVIYADTQYQWMLSAYGVWRQGMVVGTIYSTLGEEGAFYGMNQAQCPLVIADGKLAKVLARVAPKLKNLKHAVLFDVDQNREEVEMLKDAGVNVLSIDELEAIGREKPQKPTPPVTDDTAVLMYTSGTTGNPKGVLLSHRAIVAIMASTMASGSALGSLIKQRPKYIAYLPLAHIMELAVECVLLYCGCSLGFGSPGTILPPSPKVLQMTPPQKGDGEALRPDVFVAAPTVLDRLYALVNGKIRAAPKVVQKLFACALASGASRFEAGKVRGAPPWTSPRARCDREPLPLPCRADRAEPVPRHHHEEGAEGAGRQRARHRHRLGAARARDSEVRAELLRMPRPPGAHAAGPRAAAPRTACARGARVTECVLPLRATA